MINWGILGTGKIARAMAISIKDSKNSKLYATASRGSVRAKKFSEEYNCLDFNNYQGLLNDPNIDAVYIALPHNLHFEWALNSLNAGKSVLCEKPLTLNATETMILIDKARKNKLLLMEAFMYRTHPQTSKIKEIIKQYFTNKPLMIEASFGFNMGIRARFKKNHRLLDPALGGGSILDIGCYPMSMSRMIVGCQEDKDFINPVSISAEGSVTSKGVDLNTKASLVFPNGSQASIKCAINKSYANSVFISNEEKSLYIDQPWHCGEFQGRSSRLVIKEEKNKTEIIELKQELGVFTYEIDHFVQLLDEKQTQSNLVTHADTYGNMIWLDAWRKELNIQYSQDRPESRIKKNFLEINDNDILTIPSLKVDHLGIEPSRLVFGCDNQVDDNHAFAMFDHFFSLGGNVFDTAYIYNEGKSDKYLGKWIKDRGIGSQVLVLGKGAHTPYCLPEFIRPQLEESLSRLQLDKIDLYCLHRDNLDVPVKEFIDALNELKDEGLINIFGASNWTLNRFKAACDYADLHDLESFRILSNNFSLARMLEPIWPGCESCSDESFKSFLEEKNILVFPWSSQARGFFLDHSEFQAHQHIANPNEQERERVWNSKDNFERRNRCFLLAKEKGVEPIQIVLSFCLQQRFPTFPLIGPRNIFETTSSVGSFKIDLTKDQINWLDLR